MNYNIKQLSLWKLKLKTHLNKRIMKLWPERLPFWKGVSMSSSVTAPTAPDSDNGSPQGHCSRCHRVWTLKTRQGVCQWCSHLAICQSSQTKPRSIKSRSNGYKRQAPIHNNGYDQLQGEWLAYYKIASRFTDRVKPQDKENILPSLESW